MGFSPQSAGSSFDPTIPDPYFSSRMGSAIVAFVGLGLSAQAPIANTDWDVTERSRKEERAVIRPQEQSADTGIPMNAPSFFVTKEPDIRYSPSVRTMLTDRVQHTLNFLLPALKKEARRSFIPLTRIEVRGFVDPEEDTQEVVIVQWVNVSPEMALDYWDKLSFTVDAWAKSLPQDLASIIEERIALEVRWDKYDAAA